MSTEYKAYLLRLRRDEREYVWRATLEDAHTGELLRFATQNEMLRYLLQKLAEPTSRLGQPPKPDNRTKGGNLSDPT